MVLLLHILQVLLYHLLLFPDKAGIYKVELFGMFFGWPDFVMDAITGTGKIADCLLL